MTTAQSVAPSVGPVQTPARDPAWLNEASPPLGRRWSTPEGDREALRRNAARLVFETAVRAADLDTVEDLDSLFEPIFERFGFTVFIRIRLDRCADGLVREVISGRVCQDWERRYASRQFLPVDPVVLEMLASPDAGFWSELSLRRGGLDRRALQVLQEANSFGMTDGFFMPVHRPGGSMTGVVMAGSSIDPLDPDTRTAARILATAYHLNSCRLRQEPTNRQGSALLKERQIECLRWVAAGKSSAEIAVVLQLSRKTIDEHIDNACKVFGVNTRIQAVIQAIKFNIISLSGISPG